MRVNEIMFIANTPEAREGLADGTPVFVAGKNGEVWPAWADRLAAGGFTNRDTWEDFTGYVIAFAPYSMPKYQEDERMNGVKKWLLFAALGMVRERVRYEDGPRMSVMRLEVRYKMLMGREYVLSRQWVKRTEEA